MDSMENQEFDETGKACKGGGYVKKGGKLVKMRKSLTPEDLEKSIRKLAELADSPAPQRKDALLSKASTSGLSAAEQQELFDLLGGRGNGTASSNITKSFRENEPLQKAIDVSGYLRENHEALEKSLEAIGEEIQKSDNRRHEFALLQARALVDIGTLVKSMAEQMDAVLGQPARPPKSAGAQPLAKSFAGQAPEAASLSKSEILDTLENMAKSQSTVAGENVAVALSQYEATNLISKNMLAAVQQHQSKAAR